VQATQKRIDLAKCLEKQSVEELDKYIKANKEELNKELVKAWEVAEAEQRTAILNKLISNNPYVSNVLKCQANRWLKANGYGHEIGRCKQ